MRRLIFALLILFLSLATAYSLSPENSKGESLVISFDDESEYALLYQALKKEVNLEWYEQYTSADPVLVSSSFDSLSSALPLSSFVFSVKKNNAIGVLSLTDGSYFSFTFLDGKIHAVSFDKDSRINPSSSQNAL